MRLLCSFKKTPVIPDTKMVLETGYAKNIFLRLFFLFTQYELTSNDNCPSLTAAYMLPLVMLMLLLLLTDIKQSSIILHNRLYFFLNL
jgi:hypothetical protein